MRFPDGAPGISRWARAAVLIATLLAWALPAHAQRRAPSRGATTRPAAAAVQDTARLPAAPVIVRDDTLFILRDRLGPFSPAERAAAIQSRLRRLALGTADTVIVVTGETADDLMVNDNMVMSVSDADARSAAVPRAQLSALWAERLTQGLRQSGTVAVVKVVALGALWTLLATAVLVLALRLLSYVFPQVYQTLEGWRGTRITSVKFQRLVLLSADRATDGLIGGMRFIRFVLVVVLLYFYIPLVLSFFPWTKPLANRLLESVLTPLGAMWASFVDYLPNVFVIVAIVLVTRYALVGVRMFFRAVGRGTVVLENFEREWAEPTYKIARFLVLVFVLVIIVPYLPGSKSEAFKGVSLFLGVLLSIGSSSAIANLVAGVVLTYTRSFRLGDRVKIGDSVGDVVAQTLLVTRIRTIKNVDVTVPNSMVLSSHVLNYSAVAAEHGLILNTRVTIGYDTSWRKVHELLLAAADASEDVLKDPKPFVLQIALDDFYITYELNAYTADPHTMASTYSTLHANIQDAFAKAGIEIMSPHYRAERDGNPPALPPGGKE